MRLNHYTIDNNSNISSTNSTDLKGIRPVITVKPGTKEKPYIIE